MTKLQLLYPLGLGLGGPFCFINFCRRGFQTIPLSGGASPAKASGKTYPSFTDPTEVFYTTPLSYAMVNLRPVVPGHLFSLDIKHAVPPRLSTHGGYFFFLILMMGLSYPIVCWREVKRFADLTVEETQDLWLTAQKIGGRLECFHKASSLTFTIQDGPKAGQTVPHVHIHILPRKDGDFERNDEIYDEIDVKENELKEKLNLDKERKDRSREEMCKEAEEYRSLFVLQS
ncbi:hypothetical protein GOBAR_AA06931 [Gossypium barbadense]|uniref:Bis(5'-adenosyl)-triphosphatase n=1 Tax=Gossypium barbadense TaxID=3634 RepID=A0A2P5YDH1_GOSBA|nr:hypothetical protein GOBAR_AA06931 [Gossypium barbadense]